MKITKGMIPSKKKIVLYGPEGIGKSTFASKFPDPVFIDTEGSTRAMDVSRFPAPEKWEDILEAVNYVIDNPDCCKTLVIDTADWAEMLCIKYTCQKGNVGGIEDFGYGKGYVYVQENFKELLLLLEKVINKGVNVVITAHANMRKFEQPDEMGAYDRWEMKLTKKIAPMVKEWGDMVLFANYKTLVIEDDKTKKKKAQGGKRVMYTTHNPCWDAKNRYGLDECLIFDYDAIKSVIEDRAEAEEKKPEKKAKAKVEEPKKEAEAERSEIEELKALMAKDKISENRLLYSIMVKSKDFTATTLEGLDPEFIRKSLIEKWNGFVKYARKFSEEEVKLSEIPFED